MSIQILTKVRAGIGVVVIAPQLHESDSVAVTIEPAPESLHSATLDMLNFVRSPPASRRMQEGWEAFDRDFRVERDAWE